MRQVNRGELIYIIANAVRTVTPSTWRLVTDSRQEVALRGRAALATIIADKLSRLEVLSDAPAVSDDFFTRPLANMAGSDETGAIGQESE